MNSQLVAPLSTKPMRSLYAHILGGSISLRPVRFTYTIDRQVGPQPLFSSVSFAYEVEAHCGSIW